jgi:hypothetical protein
MHCACSGAVFWSLHGFGWQHDAMHVHNASLRREINKISGLKGTAVNVQSMVYGNVNDNSGTGVLFTRNPATGVNELFGEFLINAQGEDVVAGERLDRPAARSLWMSGAAPDSAGRPVTGLVLRWHRPLTATPDPSLLRTTLPVFPCQAFVLPCPSRC